MKNDTKLFFVVDSIEDNEEIFETLEEAQVYIMAFGKICDLPPSNWEYLKGI